MIHHLITLIQHLGYTAHEASVYLAALSLGGSTETEIATKAKLPRTTVASIVVALQKKGLLNSYLKGRRRIWGAENPEKLMTALSDRELQLKAALPELHSLHGTNGPMVAPRAYVGVDEIKKVLRDMIETKHHIFALVPWDEWAGLIGKRTIDRFTSIRKKRFLRFHLLTPNTPLAEEAHAHDAEDMRITRFLPEGLAIGNANFIYEDKLVVVSFGNDKPVGVVIDDAGVNRTAKTLFTSLWLRSGGSLDELSL